MSDPPAAAPTAAPLRHIPWYHARPAIVAALILLYPLGIFWLLKSPRPRRWEKLAAAVCLLPVFILVVALLLYPYWDFGGGVKLSGFRLDFSKGRQQYTALERQRQAQQRSAASPFQPTKESLRLFWPAFRGPRRDGIVADAKISLDWRAGPPREIWRQPIGEGYAAFVLGNGRAYTIEQRRDREAVTCYDPATGRELWAFDYPASFSETLGGDGPRATPTLQDDRLYSLGAKGDLNCLDALSGKRLWHRNILAEFGAENLHWGLSDSPLVFDDTVVVTGSGKGGGSIMALAADTGKLIWKTDAGQQGYSSPMLVTLAGRRQILNLAAAAFNGIDPDSGALLWSFPWRTQYGINCSQPLFAGDDRVFISSGYGQGCALIQIETHAGRLRPRRIWSNTKMKNKFTSSVIHNGHIYGLNERVLVCLDLKTGDRCWRGTRYDYGSLLLVGDHLLILGERGQLALVRADPKKFVELGRIQILPGRSWNNMAFTQGRLFARNHKEMVCYDLRPRGLAQPAGAGG